MTGLVWRKANASKPNGNCVELAQIPEGVAVRDSKDPDGPVLHLTDEQYANLHDCMAAGGLAYLAARDGEAHASE